MFKRTRQIVSWYTFVLFMSAAHAQSLGGAGTVEGTVVDPSGARIPGASIDMKNPVSGYSRAAQTDANGTFRFTAVPPNPYHLDIRASGFAPFAQEVTVRTSVPMTLEVRLALAAGGTTVTVEAEGEHLIENVPHTHNDVDRAIFSRLPAVSPHRG